MKFGDVVFYGPPESRERQIVFFDCEFTGLTANAQLISVAMLNEKDELLYVELEFDKRRCCEFVKLYVLPNLLNQPIPRDEAAERIYTYLENCGPCELWGAAPHYDWVLLADLLKCVDGFPANVFPRPFDIDTLLRLLDIDPRWKYNMIKKEMEKQNLVRHAAHGDVRSLSILVKKLELSRFIKRASLR